MDVVVDPCSQPVTVVREAPLLLIDAAVARGDRPAHRIDRPVQPRVIQGRGRSRVEVNFHAGRRRGERLAAGLARAAVAD